MLNCSSFRRAAQFLAFILGGFVASLLFTIPARAQDGVTGGRPSYSAPKTPPSAPGIPPDQQEQVIRVPSNLVTTPVAVIDGSGQFVYGLNEKDFEILDNG